MWLYLIGQFTSAPWSRDDDVPKTESAFSVSCRFQVVIWFGWTSYCCANSPRVFSPAINRSQRHFYASAIYAYFYLLGKEWLDAPNPFERRFRMACDLYNGALAEALADADGNLQLVPTQVELPVGRFSYSVDRGGSVRSDSIFCF